MKRKRSRSYPSTSDEQVVMLNFRAPVSFKRALAAAAKMQGKSRTRIALDILADALPALCAENVGG